MARLTVFGAGAMGTALAMHAARTGIDTALWANPHDERALQALRTDGRHPALPEHVPSSLAIHGPDELDRAAKDVEIAVLAATSDTARSLAGMVADVVGEARFLVSLAKGIESETGRRISEVYGEELPGTPVVVVAGPCLAPEVAEGAPSATVWAAASVDDARAAGEQLATHAYQLSFTDDIVGVEHCTSAKNVAAVGMGILDGLGKLTDESFRNAKAALFTKAVQELCSLVEAIGGRRETALGLAGLGDVLVTGTGGRNRLFGELVGEGEEPNAALRQLESRGMTVEGVASAADVRRLIEETELDLPYHRAVYRILFEGGDPRTILDVLV
jgi:glycerol-3-phosphate dehydrogenase (NAD(P)+)